MQGTPEHKQMVEEERWELLGHLEQLLRGPMAFLGLVWLVLLIVQLVHGLSPLLTVVVNVIWGLFVLDFLVEFGVAPKKVTFLKANWLILLALLVPALRVAQVFPLMRVALLARGLPALQLVTVLGSLNRGMSALRASMKRRGFGYVVALTAIVLLVGAAAMYGYEQAPPGRDGLHSYAHALWYTTMIVMTIGSEYWPHTAEGRVLTVFLGLYAFAIFGYVSAALATFFIGRDAEDEGAEIAGQNDINEIKVQLAALRQEVQALRQALTPGQAGL